MSTHSTNYYNTFIEISPDSRVSQSSAPPLKMPQTAAQLEYTMLINHPYQFTSDDVLYESNGRRRGMTREAFFSKGQPCFRSSALPKRYGWGIHFDDAGKIAIYAVESAEYKRLAADETLKHLKAMRSSKSG